VVHPIDDADGPILSRLNDAFASVKAPCVIFSG